MHVYIPHSLSLLSPSHFVDVNYFPNVRVNTQLVIPCYSCRVLPGSNASYTGQVMWCVTIWNPTQLIEACFNRTWNYSTPLAKELGILSNLEIIDSCRWFIFNYKECIRIRNVELYYEEAIFLSLRGNMQFISNVDVNCEFMIIRFFYYFNALSVEPNEPTHHIQDFPSSPMYVEAGSNISLDCIFSSTAHFNLYIGWSLSNRDLFNIAEDPRCIVSIIVHLLHKYKLIVSLITHMHILSGENF